MHKQLIGPTDSWDIHALLLKERVINREILRDDFLDRLAQRAGTIPVSRRNKLLTRLALSEKTYIPYSYTNSPINIPELGISHPEIHIPEYIPNNHAINVRYFTGKLSASSMHAAAEAASGIIYSTVLLAKRIAKDPIKYGYKSSNEVLEEFRDTLFAGKSPCHVGGDDFWSFGAASLAMFLLLIIHSSDPDRFNNEQFSNLNTSQAYQNWLNSRFNPILDLVSGEQKNFGVSVEMYDFMLKRFSNILEVQYIAEYLGAKVHCTEIQREVRRLQIMNKEKLIVSDDGVQDPDTLIGVNIVPKDFYQFTIDFRSMNEIERFRAEGLGNGLLTSLEEIQQNPEKATPYSEYHKSVSEIKSLFKIERMEKMLLYCAVPLSFVPIVGNIHTIVSSGLSFRKDKVLRNSKWVNYVSPPQ